MKIALVAAPFDARMPALMDQVDLVSVNKSEVEAYEAAIGGSFRDRKDISFLVTYGADGAEFVSGGQSTRVHAHKVDAVDTTGAGTRSLAVFWRIMHWAYRWRSRSSSPRLCRHFRFSNRGPLRRSQRKPMCWRFWRAWRLNSSRLTTSTHAKFSTGG